MAAPKRTPESRELGRRLKVLREERGLNQRQVADALGMSESGYAAWERGYAGPSVVAMQSLAHALGVTVGRLATALNLTDPSTGGDPLLIARSAIADLPLRPSARRALLDLTEDLLRTADDDCRLRFAGAWAKVTEEYAAWQDVPRDAWLVRIEQELRLHMFGT